MSLPKKAWSCTYTKFMGDNKTRLAIAKETFDIEQKERSVCHFVRGQSKQVWK